MSTTDSELIQKYHGDFQREGYQLQSVISAGSQSILFKAKQLKLEREVAIKFVQQEQSKSAQNRLHTEAKLLSTFDHPNIVTYYGMGTIESGETYISMELLQGKSLADLLTTHGPIGEAQLRTVAIQICDALDYAHSRNIIHRDVKPSNVVLIDVADSGKHQAVKLLDFGLLKDLSENSPDQNQTQTQAPVGTVNYMSPEQCRGGKVDARTDIYSLGCLLYELSSGKAPMDAETNWLVLSNHLNKKIESVPNAIISKSLERTILKCLEKSPENRFSSASLLRKQLEAPYQERINTKLLLLALLVGSILAATIVVSLNAQKTEIRVSKELPAELSATSYKLSWKDFYTQILTKAEEADRDRHFSNWVNKHIQDLHSGISDDLCEGLLSDRLEHVPNSKLEELRKILSENISPNSKYSKEDATPKELLKRKALLGLIAVRQGDWKEADRQYREIFTDKRMQGDDSFEQSRGYICTEYFAIILRDRKDSKLANDFFDFCISRVQSPVAKIYLLIQRADSERKLGDANVAKEYLDQASSILFANPHIKLSKENHLLFAIRLADASPSTFPKLTSILPPQTAEEAMKYATVYFSSGNYTQAQKYLNFPTLGTSFDKPAIKNQLTQMKLKCALAEKSKKLLPSYTADAIALLKNAKTRDFDFIQLNDAVAEACIVCPDIIKQYDAAVSPVQPLYAAYLHNQVAHHLFKTKDFDSAKKEYELTHQYFDRDKEFNEGRVSVYSNQAEVFIATKEYGQAHKIIEAGKNYARGNKLKVALYHMPLIEAYLLSLEKHYAEANIIYLQVLKQIGDQKMEYKNEFQTCIHDLCSNYISTNDESRAKELLKIYRPSLLQISPQSWAIESIEKMLAHKN